MDTARKQGRYGHRDATMIQVACRYGLLPANVRAFRPGLRPADMRALRCNMFDLARGLLHGRSAWAPSRAEGKEWNMQRRVPARRAA
jgi:hypothetical protein